MFAGGLGDAGGPAAFAHLLQPGAAGARHHKAAGEQLLRRAAFSMIRLSPVSRASFTSSRPEARDGIGTDLAAGTKLDDIVQYQLIRGQKHGFALADHRDRPLGQKADPVQHLLTRSS